MTDPAPTPPQGTVATVVTAASSVLGILPPAFIALLLINVAFLGIVFWFLNTQQILRNEFAGKFLQACLTQFKAEPR
jgi:hypothetical protein